MADKTPETTLDIIVNDVDAWIAHGHEEVRSTEQAARLMGQLLDLARHFRSEYRAALRATEHAEERIAAIQSAHNDELVQRYEERYAAERRAEDAEAVSALQLDQLRSATEQLATLRERCGDVEGIAQVIHGQSVETGHHSVAPAEICEDCDYMRDEARAVSAFLLDP